MLARFEELAAERTRSGSRQGFIRIIRSSRSSERSAPCSMSMTRGGPALLAQDYAAVDPRPPVDGAP